MGIDEFGEPREQAQAQRVAPDQRRVGYRLERACACDQRIRGRAAKGDRRGIAQPVAYVLDQRERLGAGGVGAARQLDDPVVDRACERKEHRQLRLQGAQRPHPRQQARGVEGEVDRQLVKLVDVGGEPTPVAVERGVGGPCQGIARPALGIAQDHIDTGKQRRGHGLRKDEAVDQAAAQDADRDLLHAQRRGGEDRARRRDRRKPDDARGIARQQEDIGARGPVEQRDVEAEPEPECQAKR